MRLSSADLTTIPKPIAKWPPILAIILVLVTGLVDLRKPFAGDQALFVTGARALSHGAMLYRDFWDLKQPGIYWFYQLGIQLPGSPEVAVHSLELEYFVLFAAVIIATLRRHFQQPMYAALAAALVCGIYFVICGSTHLTQVEGLVGFPLFLSGWLLLHNSDRLLPGRVFLAGLTAGCVIMFKLVLILLPLCFILMLIVRQRHQSRSLLSCLLSLLMFCLGVGVVLLPLIYIYQSHDQLNLLYDTFIDDPLRITRELPHTPLSVLKAGVIWFVKYMGVLFPLAIVGVYFRRKDWFTWGMIIWITVGLGLIILQRKGWDYHYLLLLCPIGILAAGGTEFLASKRRGIALIPILLLSPYLVMGLGKAVTQIHDPRPAFYAEANETASILNAPNAAPGPIYVLGTPLIYYLSDRSQAIVINGWSPEWLLSDQWKEAAVELRVKRPGYIFVAADDQEPLDQRGQSVAEVLMNSYAKAKSDNTGRWYKRKVATR